MSLLTVDSQNPGQAPGFGKPNRMSMGSELLHWFLPFSFTLRIPAVEFISAIGSMGLNQKCWCHFLFISIETKILGKMA